MHIIIIIKVLIPYSGENFRGGGGGGGGGGNINFVDFVV